MIHKLGYPKSLLSVEKSLSEIAHINFKKDDIPNRRVDIVCFSQKWATPLLLIECKKEIINQKSLRQLIGYNTYVQAPFIAAASQSDLIMGCYSLQDKAYKFYKGLLSYKTLDEMF